MTWGLSQRYTRIGVFTARPGLGKSFGPRCFAKKLNPNLYHMEYIRLSTISVMEFYRQICACLGVEDKGVKPGMFKSIQGQIRYLYKEKRQPLLLAIDEAQYLSTGILNDIKMRMNYRYNSISCFTLVLCGEPHLNNTLRRPIHEALRQRITVHYDFVGLSNGEASRYVLHKISCAGGTGGNHQRSGALCGSQPFTRQSPADRQHHDGCLNIWYLDGPEGDQTGGHPCGSREPEPGIGGPYGKEKRQQP